MQENSDSGQSTREMRGRQTAVTVLCSPDIGYGNAFMPFVPVVSSYCIFLASDPSFLVLPPPAMTHVHRVRPCVAPSMSPLPKRRQPHSLS